MTVLGKTALAVSLIGLLVASNSADAMGLRGRAFRRAATHWQARGYRLVEVKGVGTVIVRPLNITTNKLTTPTPLVQSVFHNIEKMAVVVGKIERSGQTEMYRGKAPTIVVEALKQHYTPIDLPQLKLLAAMLQPKTPVGPRVDLQRFGRSWRRQNNGWDCGPLLLLNAIVGMGFTPPHQSARAVRKAINALRRSQGLNKRGRSERIGSEDQRDYMEKYLGLSSESYFNRALDGSASITEALKEPYALVAIKTNANHATAAQHFVGFLPHTPGKVVMIDSLHAGPQVISEAKMMEMIAAVRPGMLGVAGDPITVFRQD
ncbi:MAG: hypothetical protein H6707_00690 [Deltaproteobacteria bacterium]|nr:hypothetical protein [Deltaproteobacteria bacterium]